MSSCTMSGSACGFTYVDVDDDNVGEEEEEGALVPSALR